MTTTPTIVARDRVVLRRDAVDIHGKRIPRLVPLRPADVLSVDGEQVELSAAVIAKRRRGAFGSIDFLNVTVHRSQISAVLPKIEDAFDLRPSEIVSFNDDRRDEPWA